MSVVPQTIKASPFAHLASAPSKPSAAEDDKDKKDEKDAKAEGDDKDEKDMAEDDSDDGEKDEKKSKKSKAKAEDDEPDAKAEGDDDSDGDDDKKPDARAARARERGRIKAILLSEPGKANPVAAAHLATGTSMPRKQAVEMLSAMQASAPAAPAAGVTDKLRSRMSSEPTPVVGVGDAGGAQPSLAQQIVMAGKKRRGEA